MLLALSLLAQENAAAILRSSGVVLLNNNPAPSASAIYPGVLIETGRGSAAVIELSGSRVDIAPETLLTFEGGDLSLDHGSLSIYTSHGLGVRVGCLMILPMNDAEWTRYEVSDLNSTVVVSAVKSDVYIDSGGNGADRKAKAATGREVIHEGERKSRDEKCGRHQGTSPDGNRPFLDSPEAIIAGAGAVIFVTCWALCRSSQPLSPQEP